MLKAGASVFPSAASRIRFVIFCDLITLLLEAYVSDRPLLAEVGRPQDSILHVPKIHSLSQ